MWKGVIYIIYNNYQCKNLIIDISIRHHVHAYLCTRTNAGYACRPTISRAHNRPSSRPSRSPHLRPSRPYVYLLLPFCHPLFIRSRGAREETWPHASSHGPNNGGYTGPLPVVCPLVLRWSRAPTTQCSNFFFRIPFYSIFFSFAFSLC